MKIKKIFVSFLLTALFSIGTISAESFLDRPPFNQPPVFGFSASEKAAFNQDRAFLQTEGGIFLSSNPWFPDLGPVLGLLDYEIFADYSFKTNFNSIFDNSIEAGFSASCLFFNAALVPVWHLDDKKFDFDYRIGFRIGKYGTKGVLEHFGSEIFAYFQAPFISIEDFEFSLGIKIRIVPQKM